jgi:hypothetical protein
MRAAMKVVVPQTTDELLINPGKGWVVFSGINPGAFGLFPEAAIAYLRVNWADLEPREGDYRWDLWEPAMRFWTGTGKRIALSVMCANAHSRGKWCTPQWVADAGAKGYDYLREGDEYNVGAPITRWEPDYADPVFLEKLERFVAAFAVRYDGNPQIEFIDIRSYGIWGEWHTPHPVGTDVLKRHIDMHVRHFRRTQLVVPWGMDANIPVYRHAFDRGVGFRRDGVGGPPVGREAEMYPLVWGKAPVVFEFWGHYEWLKEKGWWSDFPIEPYMEKQHASYISLYHEKNARTFIDQEPDYIRRLGNRMGYWFILTRADYADSVAPGGMLDVTLRWENRGVANCLANYPLAIFLINSQDCVVSTTVSAESDTRRWEPGKTATERIRIPVPADLQPGVYTVSIGLLESPLSNRCAVRLGIVGRDTEGRYPLGEVVVGENSKEHDERTK